MDTLLETIADAIETLQQYERELKADPSKASDTHFVELIQSVGYELGSVEEE